MAYLVLAFVLSCALCGLYLWLARRWQILDMPNERSAHQRPTPHGGGLPLMTAFLLSAGLCALAYGPWPEGYQPILVVAGLLTLLGVLDDLWNLPVGGRFFLYGMVAAMVSGALLQGRIELTSLPGGLLFALVSMAVLWTMNLYNFMDGIDGLAATQAILACASAALLSRAYGGTPGYALLCLLLAASHLGFLLWNWQPARLFMGDAGSIPTGFLIAALALLGAVQGELPIACWLILLAAFITDATATLAWRVVTKQAFTRPHRSHAYQRLSRYWGSHRRVVLLLLVLHALWLFPLAWAASVWPYSQLFLVILAYLPLLFGMAKVRDFA
jgi:Fuc2NAc and GlcNAc transferase